MRTDHFKGLFQNDPLHPTSSRTDDVGEPSQRIRKHIPAPTDVPVTDSELSSVRPLFPSKMPQHDDLELGVEEQAAIQNRPLEDPEADRAKCGEVDVDQFPGCLAG